MPPATQRHLLLDQVLPLLIGAQGKLVLHGSAAAVSWGGTRKRGKAGVAFVGETGRGKSTLCASLLQAGAALICDDSLILERHGSEIHAVPSYPSVRLWPDMAARLNGKHSTVAHYTSKQRIVPRTPLRNRVPLRALYLLGTRHRAESVSAARLSPREALEYLLPHCFRMLPHDRAYMRREFMALGALVEAVPVYQLEYPRRLNALRRVRELIESHIEASEAARV